MYSKCHLNSSGKESFTFMGREIASASNRHKTEETMETWDRVVAYEIDPVWAAEQGKLNGTVILPYTVGVAKRTRWKGGRQRYKTVDVKTIDEILEIVRVRVPEFLKEIEEQLRVHVGQSA